MAEAMGAAASVDIKSSNNNPFLIAPRDCHRNCKLSPRRTTHELTELCCITLLSGVCTTQLCCITHPGGSMSFVKKHILFYFL